MRKQLAIAVTSVILFGVSTMTVNATPATKPIEIELSPGSDASVGLSFVRPAMWHSTGAKVINTKSRETEILFEMDGFDAGTRSSLKFSHVDNGTETKIDTTTQADSSATASKVFSIDGQPARLTAYKVGTESELLIVQTAKGTHLYTITMVFPSSQCDKYLALAGTVCESVRITHP
jgi:hypothetical protein